jgi:hypothetical protein
MRHPEYPTSIRLTYPDKRRLRKLAAKWQLSLAGLIQMILKQWLEAQESKEVKKNETAKGAVEVHVSEAVQPDSVRPCIGEPAPQPDGELRPDAGVSGELGEGQEAGDADPLRDLC